MMADKKTHILVQRLESLQRAGVTHLGKKPRTIVAKASAAGKAATSAKPAASKPATAKPTATKPTVAAKSSSTTTAIKKQATPELSKAATTCGSSDCAAAAISKNITISDGDPRRSALAALAKKVAACKRCSELAETRTQTVFGVGNPYSKLVFCGEAPGADEDRQGEPFVGRAGQLLNDIIAKGMKMQREEVYILNILRCRPPNNRTPLPVEAAACREFLDKQLAIIQPEFICCLGAVAAQNLLNTDTPIGRLRGSIHDYQGIKVVCTYHPAYVLRNPQAKKPVWEDIQMLMAEMGLAK
jgi:uracil-DNA glycosylase